MGDFLTFPLYLRRPSPPPPGRVQMSWCRLQAQIAGPTPADLWSISISPLQSRLRLSPFVLSILFYSAFIPPHLEVTLIEPSSEIPTTYLETALVPLVDSI